MAYYKLAAHEKLQKKFADLYCAAYLVGSIEGDISKYIRSELGDNVSDKIDSIGVDLDYEELILRINVANHYRKEVFEKLKEVFPGWEWHMEYHTNFSDISLILDDDKVREVPLFFFEE